MEPPSAIKQSLAAQSTLFTPPQVHLEVIAKANDLTGLSSKIIALGEQLETAFHHKDNPQRIVELVAQGAPVNYRLDYALEIKREADFVYEFYILLEGDKNPAILLANIKTLFGESADGIFNYVKTAEQFYDALYAPHANQIIIPVNPAYLNALKLNAANGRVNPSHANGALHSAAGIRDADLVKDIINRAKSVNHLSPRGNGGNVNFIGFFEDTPAVWSVILLDYQSLQILIENGATMENLGMLKATLLHWVVAAVKISATSERIEKAKQITELLINKGIHLNATNRLGKTALDYADGDFKAYLMEKMDVQNNKPNCRQWTKTI